MESRPAQVALPPIPAKRYFTIGEVSDLCAVKPHVLRYWEQEFTQLRPMKRRGNRRYYQHHEVLLIRKIRELLYEQGFTISGARNQLMEGRALTATTPLIATLNAAPVVNGHAMADPVAQPENRGVRDELAAVLAILRGKSSQL
jgi:DNA-binding transcriptional MerR regulator